MKIFLFEDATKVSNSYHDGGSFLVVARDRQHVEEQIATYNRKWPSYDDIPHPCIIVSQNDWDNVKMWPTSDDAQPYLTTFPDAGCC